MSDIIPSPTGPQDSPLAQRTVEVMDIAASTRKAVSGLISMTITQALNHLRPGVPASNFSVFVNRTPIPASDYDAFTLSPGDVLGFMTNKQGGSH